MMLPATQISRLFILKKTSAIGTQTNSISNCIWLVSLTFLAKYKLIELVYFTGLSYKVASSKIYSATYPVSSASSLAAADFPLSSGGLKDPAGSSSKISPTACLY